MAKGKRGSRARVIWFIDNVTDKVNLTMKQRVSIATSMLHSKIVKNVSRSVGRSGGKVTARSKKGEFPRADTTQLMKTLFWDVKRIGKRATEGFVGTPLDYAVILELHRDRSFLVRTLNEERPMLKRILTRKMR